MVLFFRRRLLEKLVGSKLSDEMDRLLADAEQGFDIAVVIEEPELRALFTDMVQRELEPSNRRVQLVLDWEQANHLKSLQDTEPCYCPIVLPLAKLPPPGSGFLRWELPRIPALLPAMPIAVGRILEFAGLATYMDVFDAQKISRIKVLALNQALGVLVDTVVHVAYLAGLKGNAQEAERFLNETVESSGPADIKPPRRGAVIQIMELVLQNCDDPHSYLKSALSHYVVRVQGKSIALASKRLDISRTTLQQHLRLADKYGVNKLFDERAQS